MEMVRLLADLVGLPNAQTERQLADFWLHIADTCWAQLLRFPPILICSSSTVVCPVHSSSDWHGQVLLCRGSSNCAGRWYKNLCNASAGLHGPAARMQRTQCAACGSRSWRTCAADCCCKVRLLTKSDMNKHDLLQLARCPACRGSRSLRACAAVCCCQACLRSIVLCWLTVLSQVYIFRTSCKSHEGRAAARDRSKRRVCRCMTSSFCHSRRCSLQPESALQSAFPCVLKQIHKQEPSASLACAQQPQSQMYSRARATGAEKSMCSVKTMLSLPCC